MSGTNQFLVFAGGAGANTMTPAAYAQLAAVSTGFQSGIAQSVQANTVWRQSSIIATMIAQFIVNNSGQSAIDNGTIATLLANFQLSVQKASGRTKVTAPLSIFVSPSGNDSNTGLTASTPFLTIQAAYEYVANNYDMANQQLTIRLANGTYSTGLVVSGSIPGQGGNPINVVGNTSSPASVIVNSNNTQTNTFVGINGGYMNISGMTINTSGTGQGGWCIVGQVASIVTFSNIIFGSATSGHIIANFGGNVQCVGNYTISGAAAPCHLSIGPNASLIYDGSGGSYTIVVTIQGTPNFSNGFIVVQQASSASFSGTSWVGSATGQKYLVSTGSTISTDAGGVNFFPGSTAGNSTTGYYQ